MGYLDKVADRSIKTDSHGREVYFPFAYGRRAKGYVLPDAATAAALRRKLKITNVACFVFCLCAWVSGAGWLVLAVCWAATFAAFQAVQHGFARGLPISDERYSFAHDRIATLRARGKSWIWFGIVIGAALAVLGLANIKSQPWNSLILAGIGGSLIFLYLPALGPTANKTNEK